MSRGERVIAGRRFAWGERTYLMAIVNATPDSFSGDGVGSDLAGVAELARRAERDGADIIDIGGESTRPGHIPLAVNEELSRLLPAIRAVAAASSLPISVDTSRARVAEAALAAGAAMVNDIRGFTRDPELAAVVARAKVPVVVMHDARPEPGVDLVASVVRELSRRLDVAVAAGIDWDNLIVDPGFGFGKDWRQNLALLKRLAELNVLGLPILVGWSRKSTIGRVLGLPEDHRLEGTLAMSALAIANGADVLRVHDVLPNARVAAMSDAVVRAIPAAAKSWPGGPAE